MELETELKRLAQVVPSIVMAFHQEASSQAVEALQTERFAMVKLLQKAPAETLSSLWAMGLEKPYLDLLSSGFRDLPRSLLDEALFQCLLPMLNDHGGPPNQPGTLASLMLLSQSFELPLFDALESVPSWLRPHYLGFLMEPVGTHNHQGDAERCVAYLCEFTSLLHALLVNKTLTTTNDFRAELFNRYLQYSNLIQAYFSTRNLRNLYRQRGEILNAALIAAGLPTLHARIPKLVVSQRIRLGIFAQHFGPQTETYFTLSHFDQIDRTCFEIILYANQESGHSLEALCAERADRFELLPEGLQAQGDRIRDDALDILLISTNMSVVANTAALFGAMRLAPLQLASVSTPVSSGSLHTDAMLSCSWNEPALDAELHYSEKLLRMPGSVNIYAYQYDTASHTITPTRSELGLPESALVFFSGANFYKIIPEQSLTWVRILSAVPNSFLVLMPFNPNWSSSYRRLPFMERIHQQLLDHGVNPKRLKIVDPVPTRADLHRIIALTDIYLDPFPFAGACSLLDPIIVGVPPLVRSGPTGRSKHGASMMRLLDLNEQVYGSEEAYVEAAVHLAANPEERRRIRQKLLDHGKANPVTYFDTKDFSSRVGNTLQSLFIMQVSQNACFTHQAWELQREVLQKLASAAIENSHALRSMTDIGLVTQIIEPFFRSLPADRTRHVVDVGACYGSMSVPLLERGWTADLFEPDPAAHAVLKEKTSQWLKQVRLHAMAVSNSTSNTVSFHQASSHGLSGLGESPFAATENNITVACTQLRQFCHQYGITKVDFLKIDAEGYDFDVLQTHDFDAIKPRLILVEYGMHFARQTRKHINSELNRMAKNGYVSIIFNCTQDGDFTLGQWIYQTSQIVIDAPLPVLDDRAFGNILFFRRDDIDFLGALRALLLECTSSVITEIPSLSSDDGNDHPTRTDFI